MRSLILALVLLQSMFIGPITALAETPGVAKNPTDLPAYPNLWKASVTGAKGTATLYNAATHDA